MPATRHFSAMELVPSRFAVVGLVLTVVSVGFACSSQNENTKDSEKNSSEKLESETRHSRNPFKERETKQEPEQTKRTARSSKGPDMTLEKMDKIIREKGNNVEGNERVWKFTYKGTQLHCITDPRADRMRLVASITKASDVTNQQLKKAMKANFHTALDARYAISQGALFSAFIHPLSTLDPEDFRSALDQVANLAQTFGTSYSSGVLKFGGGGP